MSSTNVNIEVETGTWEEHTKGDRSWSVLVIGDYKMTIVRQVISFPNVPKSNTPYYLYTANLTFKFGQFWSGVYSKYEDAWEVIDAELIKHHRRRFRMSDATSITVIRHSGKDDNHVHLFDAYTFNGAPINRHLADSRIEMIMAADRAAL